MKNYYANMPVDLEKAWQAWGRDALRHNAVARNRIAWRPIV